MTRFDAVLCDLHGVLIRYDAAARADVEKRYGLPLTRTAFDPALIGPATLGLITEQSWIEWVSSALGGSDRARAAVAEFVRAPVHVDPAAKLLLAELRKRVPVVLVTNSTDALDDQLAHLGLADLATAVINSSKIGIAKPDPRIYQLAAERVGVAPEHCVYVDDKIENVNAARSLGMIGIHYQGVTDLAALVIAPRRGSDNVSLRTSLPRRQLL